jgi:Transposase
VRVLRRRCAPRTYPCPRCGRRGRRKDTHTRRVRDLAYQEILVIELTVGEYRARCGCCKTFRSRVEGIEARAAHTNRVREAAIDRLLDDGMSMGRLRQALARDFHLDLPDGFLYDCLDRKARRLDLPGYRRWALAQFPGTLCVGEIPLGRKALRLATDPLGDFPVAFAPVRADDRGHMRRFLQNLKAWGFCPRVVITDGPNLYPALLAELWPQARHQLCVFHVLKGLNDCVFDAFRRKRRRLARPGRRKGRRGRPRKGQRRARRGAGKRDQAHFIWKHRHLIVRRPDELSDRERQDLLQMLAYLPALAALRRFVVGVHHLFDPALSPHQARCRRAALVRVPEYQADADLARALAMPSAERFEKVIAYLHGPAARRVRTNSHVERVNRKPRHFEKVRYQWRRRRSIVRFVALAPDRWRQRGRSTHKSQASSPTTHRQPNRSRHRCKRAA